MEGFKIIHDNRHMFIKLQAVNDGIGLIMSEKELYGYFKKHDIIKGVLKNEILRAFIELYELESPQEYLVAVGKKPTDGDDGQIKFKIDMTEKCKYFAPEDDDDNSPVDYKSAIGAPVIQAGECICEITDPTTGLDGYNLQGKILPAKDGKPAKLSLGEGYKFDPTMSKVIAVNSGRPSFNANKLTLNSIYQINGDVCFETGNISFDGHVFVNGSVQDDFSIEAKSIEIKGTVGNSFIKAEKELIIYGGVNGKSSESSTEGFIECGGDIYVKYLNEANVESEGNIFVKRAIINSTVKCFGKINTHTIIGGTATAIKGIETNIAGSEIGTPTYLEVGINYRIKYYDDSLENLSWQVDSVIHPVINHLGDEDYFKKITPKNQERFLQIYENFLSIMEGYLQLYENREHVIRNLNLTPINEVVVFKHMYSDVTVSTLSCCKKFIYDFKGPIILLENLPVKSIRIENYVERSTEDFLVLETHEDVVKYSAKSSVNKIKIGSSNRTIYTRDGLINIKKQFEHTIKGQDFSVCVFEDRHFKRVTLMNALQKAGVKNIHGVKDSFEALETVKELEDKNLIVICNLHIGQKEGLEFVSRLLHKAPNNFGIFLVDRVSKTLVNAISKINSLAIYHESTDVSKIIKQIKDFGFNF